MLLAAGIAAIIGAVLPWVRADAAFFTLRRAGTEADGRITLVLGVLLGTAAIVAVATRAFRAWVGAGGILLSAFVIAIAVADIVDVNDKARPIEAAGIARISVGGGLWLTLAAGLVGLAGGIALLIRPSAQARHPVPRPPSVI